MVQIRNQQVLNRKGGWIVTCQTRQAANQRCHQMVSGHWAGLVPVRAIEADQAGNGPGDAMVLESVRGSSPSRR
jgi:hypothetical protein